jgi:hypothetical protein
MNIAHKPLSFIHTTQKPIPGVHWQLRDGKALEEASIEDAGCATQGGKDCHRLSLSSAAPEPRRPGKKG